MNKVRIVQWHVDADQLFFVQRRVGLDIWQTFACGNQLAVIEITKREMDKS